VEIVTRICWFILVVMCSVCYRTVCSQHWIFRSCSRESLYVLLATVVCVFFIISNKRYRRTASCIEHVDYLMYFSDIGMVLLRLELGTCKSWWSYVSHIL